MSYAKAHQKKIPRRRKSSKDLFDESKEINVAVKTGKVLLGANSVLKEMAMGTMKLIILAKNAPDKVTKKIKLYNACLENPIPIYISKNSSWDLGAVCGKPYWVSTIGIMDVGDSSIMNAIKQTQK